jgi:hypothetical protein
MGSGEASELGLTVEPFSRRSFVQRAGALSVGAVLAQLPALLDAKGLLPAARAAGPDPLTRDSLSGLLAFILPGDDDYSVAQGAHAKGPGAIGAGTLDPFINALDNFVPASALGQTITLPASQAVGLLLDDYAIQVNPASVVGTFLAPFANLSFAEKAKCFELLEADQLVSTVLPELRFVAGILPGFVGFMAASEAGVLEANGHLSSKPVAWKLSRYSGPSDGHPELRGYYQGRRHVRRRRRRRGGGA